MIDIVVSVKDKEYPFFMKLVENFDFVTVKGPPVQPADKQEAVQQQPEQAASPALEGPPMSSQEFTHWIEQAEAAPTISLQQAKNKWAEKRKGLQQLIK